MASKEPDSDTDFEHIESELDETSHREMGLIYDDATRTITYAKGIQWKAVASTMLVFVVLVFMARSLPPQEDFIRLLKIAVILFAMASILMLVVFQLWQHTESKKISVVESQFSSTFRLAREKKWKLEADLHRYLLLVLMIAAILFTGFVATEAMNLLAGAAAPAS